MIYCDIPYENTTEYQSGAFDHKRFYDWAVKQSELVVISSYEISDNRFKRIGYIKKLSLLAGGASKEKLEALFIPIPQTALWDKLRK